MPGFDAGFEGLDEGLLEEGLLNDFEEPGRLIDGLRLEDEPREGAGRAERDAPPRLPPPREAPPPRPPPPRPPLWAKQSSSQINIIARKVIVTAVIFFISSARLITKEEACLQLSYLESSAGGKRTTFT